MDREELDIILKEGEGYKIEFKEGIGHLEKEMVAFSNSSGGRIFLGVTDAGEIKGIKVSNKMKSRIQDMANHCRPEIKLFMETLDNVLIINVREGDDKPYECSSGFYKRIGPNSQKMTRDEIIDFIKSEGKVRFDELVEPKFNYPEDFDGGRFRRFLQLAGISRTDDIEKLITGLGVVERQEGKLYFNNAGVLFFAKEPQRFARWSVFTVALFKDEAGADIIDRKEIEGSLFEIVEEVMKFVKLYSKVAYRFTGMPQRENVYEYPFDAVREAVINSVMHKYYFEHGHNNILRFLPDRIRIENYWKKPSHFVLGETVFRRNHIIADLFARIDFGEKMGTGFERIREICQDENAPFPEIDYNEDYFYVTFRQSEEYLKLARGEAPPKTTLRLPGYYPETAQKIVDYMLENPSVTRQELAEMVGLSVDGVKYHIARLKKDDLVRRIGPARGGHWEVVRGDGSKTNP